METERIDVKRIQLISGKEKLTVYQVGELFLKAPDRTLVIKNEPSKLTITCSAPADKVVFEREVGEVLIKGQKGEVKVSTEDGNLEIQGPAGTTKVIREIGKLSMSGGPFDKQPYLGRGLFLPFHGVFVFIDLSLLCPMMEVTEWTEWRSVLDLGVRERQNDNQH